MSKKRIIVLMPGVGAGLKGVLDARDDVEWDHVTDASEANVLQRIADYEGAILGVAPFTKRIVEAASRMQIVARHGVGYDAVDVDALTAKGIPLAVVGTANSVTVAEHSLFFMLALAKRAVLYDQEVRKGNWNVRFQTPAYDLAGRTVLILGFGRIGRRLVNRCVAMEMNVLVHDPYVVQDGIATAGATPVTDWRAVLGDVDFLSVNCPKNAETNGMVGARELAAMKPTAFVVNTARGNIVDEAALCDALEKKTIAGAGIDPFVVEPATPDNPLFKYDNILVSPHSAGVTVESMYRMGATAAQNCLDCFDGKLNPENVINTEVLK